MAEEKKKGKVTESLEKTGKVVEEDLKKGWDSVKEVGKKTKEKVEGDKEKKETK